ncbi:MAG: glycosyltransferase family 1 protein [Planctomycetota bacterium]|nr:glycosyltransferase family 1 protein [Planctomycetota bacterium]
MRIAVDARELAGRPTGVGRYLAGILDAWATLPAAASHEFILCAPDPTPSALARDGLSTIVAAGSGTWWEQRVLARLVRKTRADVLFAPGYTAPLLSPAPVVVTIHDVSFAAHPEWFAWREGLRRRTLTRLTALRAARVLTVSEFSKREITERLGIGRDKIDVIYEGVPDLAVDRTQQSSTQTILYVGSLFNRRHIPELIEGFARLARKRPDVRLEIVGDNRTAPHVDIDRLAGATGAGDRIARRAYLPDEQLAALYGRARAFVFLSEYEGFGLTPLEALGAGIPIVVLDTPVAREVYGAAALYVERPEPALIEAALERVLVDETERARILATARDTLARYSWRACAEQVLDVLATFAKCRASR